MINLGSVLPGKKAMRMTLKLLTITMNPEKSEGLDMSYDRRSAAAWAIHPGEILKQDFLKPMGVSGYRLAQALDVNPQTVNDILLKKRGVSAEMALRLGIVFGMSAEFWMNLQAAYELATAKKAIKKSVKNIKPITRAA
jgi:antitoxin HigA-1